MPAGLAEDPGSRPVPAPLRLLPAVPTDPPFDDEIAGDARSERGNPPCRTPGAGHAPPGHPPLGRTSPNRTSPSDDSPSDGSRHDHAWTKPAAPEPGHPPSPGGAGLGSARTGRPAAARCGPATAGSSLGRGRQATPRAPARPRDSRLHDSPRPAAAIIVRAIVEVLAGVRPGAHLAGWATPALRTELERCRGQYPGHATIRSIRVGEPRPGIAEVVAVIARDQRVSAMALRMESAEGRWQVTTLQLA